MKDVPNRTSLSASSEDSKSTKKRKKRTLYSIFYGGNGKEIDAALISGPRNVKNFFRMLRTYFNTLFLANLLMVFGNFPFLFGLYALTGNLNETTTAPASSLFPQLYGAIKISGVTPGILPFFGVHSTMSQASVMTTATIVCAALTGLMLFTWGFVNTGTSYIFRNMVKGEPIFLWQDFWYAIKRNLKQAFFIGILDLGIIAILVYNITLTWFNFSVTSVNSFVFFANVALAFIYFNMRFYLYIQLVTFDLPIWKIFKNAFIFVFVGFRRNALAVTGIALLMLLDYILLGLLMPVGVILPFILLFGIGGFMGAYAAYPTIRKVMIDPYYESDTPGAAPRTASQDG